MYTDTHAHLDMLEDPVAALRRAGEADVGFIATVVNVLEEPERTFEQLEGWRIRAGVGGVSIPDVSIIVGTHPHDAAKTDVTAMKHIASYACDERVVALGELGLDYHYDHSPRDVQREVFAQQLTLAGEFNLPVCIHLREAHEDGLRILRESGYPAERAILHCFGLGYDAAEPFLELGCYVSFAGPISFRKSDMVRDAAARVPLDRILSETDCPFLAPEPLRGKKNEPANVRYVAEVIVDARPEPRDEVLHALVKNARQLLTR